ncbi:MAG: hypothetical protein ACKVHU_21265 [Acidimicrobiales bacterium]|jgi:hypothetical protein
MTEPSPAELLAGVAEALEQTVLPSLERGEARNQVMAAIGIVRRCGGALDGYGAMLHADCVDLLATLRQTRAAAPDLLAEDHAGKDFDDSLRAADDLLASAYPEASSLAKVHTELSNQLAVLLLAAQREGSAQIPKLRRLLERMVAREAEVGLSPW